LSRATRSERRQAGGFTIIEVLVALAVVSATLAAIGALVASSVRSTAALERHVALVATARVIVAGLPKREELAVGNFSGELAGHRWRVDVLPFAGVLPAVASPWVPHTVVVTVRGPSGGALQINTVRLLRRANG